MLKGLRVGMIIWGILILGGGVVVLLFTDGFWKYFGYPLVLGGLALFVCGIIFTAKNAAYNRRLLHDNQNVIYVTNCIHCGRPIQCQVQHFRWHKRFHEGYILCPICKQPVSRNAFRAVPADMVPPANN